MRNPTNLRVFSFGDYHYAFRGACVEGVKEGGGGGGGGGERVRKRRRETPATKAASRPLF